MSDTLVVGGTAETPTNAPIILDLGKKKRSLIRQLCNGEGPLIDEVNGCIEELQASGSISTDAQPIVIVIREKARPRSLFPGF